jgi:hypothetical protein
MNSDSQFPGGHRMFFCQHLSSLPSRIWIVAVLVATLLASHSTVTSINAEQSAAFKSCVKTAVNYGDVLSCTDHLSQANLTAPSHDGKESRGTEINNSVIDNQSTRSL